MLPHQPKGRRQTIPSSADLLVNEQHPNSKATRTTGRFAILLGWRYTQREPGKLIDWAAEGNKSFPQPDDGYLVLLREAVKRFRQTFRT